MLTRYLKTFILLPLFLAACSTVSSPSVLPTATRDLHGPTLTSKPSQVIEPATPSPTTAVPTIAAPDTATIAIIATTVSPNNTANADVTFVRAVLSSNDTWTFHVSVLHPDTGWDDYADGWDVITPDGTVLKFKPSDPFTRLLMHPHENEQPFTRSQSGIIIPEGVTQVIVRAHDLVDGFGGHEILVDLEQDAGPGFQVER